MFAHFIAAKGACGCIHTTEAASRTDPFARVKTTRLNLNATLSLLSRGISIILGVIFARIPAVLLTSTPVLTARKPAPAL